MDSSKFLLAMHNENDVDQVAIVHIKKPYCLLQVSVSVEMNIITHGCEFLSPSESALMYDEIKDHGHIVSVNIREAFNPIHEDFDLNKLFKEALKFYYDQVFKNDTGTYFIYLPDYTGDVSGLKVLYNSIEDIYQVCFMGDFQFLSSEDELDNVLEQINKDYELEVEGGTVIDVVEMIEAIIDEEGLAVGG